MKIRILFLLFGTLMLPLQAVQAKSSYPPGNYYEDGKHSPNCMRCHMLGGLNPAGTTLSIAVSRTTVVPDERVTVTVTKSNFDETWRPGVVIHLANNDKYAQRIPQDYGWRVVSGPGGLPFNYHRAEPNGGDVLTWTLQAPKKPGQYLIATSAYFKNAELPGTKRGDNTVTVTVNKVPEGQKPFLLNVESRYKSYMFVTFSEPVDEASALIRSNYRIIRIASGQVLSIDTVFMSRDGTQAVLRTGPHFAGSQYSFRVTNVADYAASPNRILDTSIVYTPDLVASYKVPCNYSQDMTASDLLYDDKVDYLGTGTQGTAARIDLAFYSAPAVAQNLDKATDGLTGINFAAAKLVLQQAESPSTGAYSGTWNVHTISGSLMAETPVGELWGGMNQSALPVASITKPVTVVSNGTPVTRWEWDVTQSFRAKYQAGAGEVLFRIKAANEANTLMPGFFGGDYDSLPFRPYIELTMDSIPSSAIHRDPKIGPGYAEVTWRTIPFAGGVIIQCLTLAGSENSKSVSVVVHDGMGKKIRNLFSGPGALLPNKIFWDGKDDRGIPLPDGLYLTQLRFGNRVVSSRAVLFH